MRNWTTLDFQYCHTNFITRVRSYLAAICLTSFEAKINDEIAIDRILIHNDKMHVLVAQRYISDFPTTNLHTTPSYDRCVDSYEKIGVTDITLLY